MRRLFKLQAILLALCAISTGCVTTDKTELVATQTFTAKFNWEKFGETLDKEDQTNCVYQAFQFRLNEDGTVAEAKAFDYTSDFQLKTSTDAVKAWKFLTPLPKKTGKLAIVYRKFDKPELGFLPEDLDYVENNKLKIIYNDKKETLKPLRRVNPKYPRQAAMSGIGGSVTVEYDVLPDGSTTNIRVVGAWPPKTFDKTAVNAVKKWQYEESIAGLKDYGVTLDYKVGLSQDHRKACRF